MAGFLVIENIHNYGFGSMIFADCIFFVILMRRMSMRNRSVYVLFK